MTSDLKSGKIRSRKTPNYKLYAVVSLMLFVIYFFFSLERSSPEAPKKYDSAASSITKGISGTFKDKSKVESSKGINMASPVDRETHALVHELKKQAEGEVPSSTLRSVATQTLISDAERGNSASAASPADKKEMIVKTTDQRKKGKPKSDAFDAADTLDVLFQSYPMIVFSKSYCPHSKRAKTILEMYDIRPRPLIYELDVEEHGAELQTELGIRTGRRTVPNVVVNSQSIGGGDEVADSDKSDTLVSKVRSLSDRIDITRKTGA